MSERVDFHDRAKAKVIGNGRTVGRRVMLLSLVTIAVTSPVAPRARAQLPDAPSASVIAPLRRYSLNVTLDNKYSPATSTYNLTSRLGMGIRLGERETLGISFSRTIDVRSPHTQTNSVLVGVNFRLFSWGRILRDR